MFVDDTNVSLNGHVANGESANFVNWLDSNKLLLNVSKTHFILFRSQGMHKPLIIKDLIIKWIHKAGSQDQIFLAL